MFYNTIAEANGQQEVIMATQRFFKKYENTHDRWAEGGQFLPLEVWAKQGFDAKRIEEHSKPENKREDPVLGLTYRVAIYSAERGGERGRQFDDQHSSGPQKVRRVEDIGAAVQARSASDSSSDSSSSTSDKKKKKKKKAKRAAKKNKKDFDRVVQIRISGCCIDSRSAL